MTGVRVNSIEQKVNLTDREETAILLQLRIREHPVARMKQDGDI